MAVFKYLWRFAQICSIWAQNCSEIITKTVLCSNAANLCKSLQILKQYEVKWWISFMNWHDSLSQYWSMQLSEAKLDFVYVNSMYFQNLQNCEMKKVLNGVSVLITHISLQCRPFAVAYWLWWRVKHYQMQRCLEKKTCLLKWAYFYSILFWNTVSKMNGF